jgi:hypothetical protein
MHHVWQRIVSYVNGRPRTAIVAAATAGVIFVTGGAALAARQASGQFADATISRLGGGDPDAVLDKLADRVVKKLTSSTGPLGSAKQELVAKISKAAADKIGTVDPKSLISGASGDLVSAGMDKIDSLDLDAVIAQVTQALIEQATAEIEKLDLEGLAKGALDRVIDSVDIEKLIKEKLDSIDVEKLVGDAVAKQLGGGTGGLLGTIFRR